MVRIEKQTNCIGELTIYTEGCASLYVQKLFDGKVAYRMKHSDVLNAPNVRIVDVDGELECCINFACTSYMDDEWPSVVKATDELLSLWYKYTSGELVE